MVAHISSAPPQIPGYQLSNEDANSLRHHVANLLGRDNPRFPGAQPISFARQHLAELQQREYFMCEKTDGIRCLLFLTFKDVAPRFDPVTMLIDRKNNYYEVTPPLRFPYHQDINNQEAFLYDTILDGELVIDQHPDGRRQLIFYVFDCLAIDGTNKSDRPLDKRLGYMQEMLFKPWRRWLEKNNMAPQQEPFLVKEKQQNNPYRVQHMFDQVLPNLKHGNDGLIFTCKTTKYEFGTDKHILKWKPPHENTIDFKLRLGDFPLFDPEDGEEGLIPDYDAMPTKFELLVNHGSNNYRTFAHPLSVTPEEWDMLKGLGQRLDGRIIECYRDTDGRWRFKKDDDGTPRWRDDKADANHISTVESVLDSIEDPVTEQDLRAAEGRIMEAVRRLRAEEAARVQHQHQQEMESAAKKRKLHDMNESAGP